MIESLAASGGLALWQLALLSAVGVVAGFLNVMAGGGSLLTVPIMVFMGIPGPVANGTNRIAILAQNISAVVAFFRRGYAEFRLSLTLTACALPGAVAGAMVGTRLEGVWFNRTLAIIMLAVMVVMYLDRDKLNRALAIIRPAVMAVVHFGRNKNASHPTTPSPAAPTPQRDPLMDATVPNQPTPQQLFWGHLMMVVVGFHGGFIQVGAGFILIPILNRLMGFDLVRTNMHKVFIIACYTAAALVVFASQVPILWLVGLALALGNSIGGWVAAAVQVRRGQGIIRLVLNGVLVAFILKLLLFP